MCIRCVCDAIIEDVEDDYVFKREEIIDNLDCYLRVNQKDVDDGNINALFSDDLVKAFNKLHTIKRMVEMGNDKNDVLYELELLSLTCKHLARAELKEMDRISDGRNWR